MVGVAHARSNGLNDICVGDDKMGAESTFLDPRTRRYKAHLDALGDLLQYVDESARVLPYIQNGIMELKSNARVNVHHREDIHLGLHCPRTLSCACAKHGVILSCALHALTAPSDVPRGLEQPAYRPRESASDLVTKAERRRLQAVQRQRQG
ncbi:hypothetical protein K438DRAFT_1964705 [Mycena galopus ATCC 62051]|nr:hypothetical protein K438DRAFT_1964705 [Mycena galopus ATCC 62051]